jgi:alanine racemase
MTDLASAGAVLRIDLDALARNYRTLRQHFTGKALAAVVKADGYGLGAIRVAPALAAAGCEHFFVAHIDEGIAVRAVLPEAAIHVLNGLIPGTAEIYREHRLIPVLNTPEEVEAWTRFARGDVSLTADIHVDTGMSRLGMELKAAEALFAEPGRLAGLAIGHLISHLACSEEQDNPMNREQLARFAPLRRMLAKVPASFVNSSGIFLGADFHFDLGRPGAALYGINPLPGQPSPMAQVVRLQGKILQVRDIDSPRTVGYGATHRAALGRRIATVAVGYADGYLRSFSNTGFGFVGEIRVPVVGRVSMDLMTLDVTEAPPALVQPGCFVDLIGPHNPVDAVAETAGTIGYEILTGLGQRYHRIYSGGA